MVGICIQHPYLSVSVSSGSGSLHISQIQYHFYEIVDMEERGRYPRSQALTLMGETGELNEQVVLPPFPDGYAKELQQLVLAGKVGCAVQVPVTCSYYMLHACYCAAGSPRTLGQHWSLVTQCCCFPALLYRYSPPQRLSVCVHKFGTEEILVSHRVITGEGN
jgi:hypothetical protein